MSERKKPVPDGTSDFKRLSKNFYYIDKTFLIKELLDNQTQVTL